MARFKYNGEPKYPNAGPCSQIIVRKKNGTKQTLTPIPPATFFAVGADIGYDITDETSLNQLNADDRFTQL